MTSALDKKTAVPLVRLTNAGKKYGSMMRGAGIGQGDRTGGEQQ